MKLIKRKVVKVLFMLLGLMAVALGILGIFIPGLPTTPFLLLAAGLFTKSSSRLYQFLLSNRFLGPYIKRYREEKGMPLRTKIHAIVLVWIMTSISVIFFIDPLWIKCVVVAAGLTGTIVMGFVIKTLK